MADYTKLSNLVGEEITIESVNGYKFKMWDTSANKMLVSDNYQQGYTKLYQVVTDKGQLDMRAGQIGSLLEVVMVGATANLLNKTFHVKSNGKTGIDIRYYFNEVEKYEEDRPQTDSSTNESDAPW